MRSYTTAALVFAILFAGAFGAGYSAGAGKGNDALVEYRTRVDTLVSLAMRLDTVYVERLNRYDSLVSLYDTIRVTDTIVVDSVVFVPRAAADEALQACNAVIVTCDEQKANLTARLAIAESIIQKKPNKHAAYLWATAGLLAGLLVR